MDISSRIASRISFKPPQLSEGDNRMTRLPDAYKSAKSAVRMELSDRQQRNVSRGRCPTRVLVDPGATAAAL